MEDNWPEFLYGNSTIEEYIHLVRIEKRDVRNEVASLVNLIRDIAKHPYETPEETFKRISLLCRVIESLLCLD
jgi:hypothetical protein